MAVRKQGQIVARGRDRYLVRVFLGRDENGRRRYKSWVVSGKKSKAEAFLRERLEELSVVSGASTYDTTVGAYLKWWLEWSENRLEPRTLKSYRRLVEKDILPVLGSVRLFDLKPIDVQRLIDSIASRGVRRTVELARAVLHSALEHAVRLGIVQENVVDRTVLPSKEKVSGEKKVLSSKEARHFLEVNRDNPWYPCFRLAIETGMRPGEYLALRWEDIDFDALLIRVRRAVKDEESKGFGVTKTGRERVVPISRALAEVLLQHRKTQLVHQAIVGDRWKDLGLVFPDMLGGVMNRNNLVKRYFKPALRRAGLPEDVKLYNLRHTCATILLEQGVHPKVVAERLGHSTIRLTMDTYSSALPTLQQDASQRIASVLDEVG